MRSNEPAKKKSMPLFFRYLKEKRKTLILWLLWTLIQGVVFLLYRCSLEPLVYASVLCLGLGLVFLLTGFFRWNSRMKELSLLSVQLDEKVLPLPVPHTAAEESYQSLLRSLSLTRMEERRAQEQKISEMLDFYTLWVHQIKTPIAAMRLLLQSDEKNALASPLQGELTRIEGYAEMVLSYLRLQSETTDYLFKKVELDPLIRGTIRRFARLFIGGRLSVSFEGTGLLVVTDEKWISIVLEQVISNAVKYTPPGGTVSITAAAAGDHTLSIADTGIGIRPEDLPRVFERGYTGFNGHDEHHSSGLGLYLCRTIMSGLGGTIDIESAPGKGTTVNLTFPERMEGYE